MNITSHVDTLGLSVGNCGKTMIFTRKKQGQLYISAVTLDYDETSKWLVEKQKQNIQNLYVYHNAGKKMEGNTHVI